jgi:hypothetical protein
VEEKKCYVEGTRTRELYLSQCEFRLIINNQSRKSKNESCNWAEWNPTTILAPGVAVRFLWSALNYPFHLCNLNWYSYNGMAP